jgi:hypothetical protein
MSNNKNKRCVILWQAAVKYTNKKKKHGCEFFVQKVDLLLF